MSNSSCQPADPGQHQQPVAGQCPAPPAALRAVLPALQSTVSISVSQNPPAALSDPPQIYLTNVGDPSSLTPLIPLGPVGGAVSPVPPPHVGPPQHEDPSFPLHPPPVFVIINPPPAQQQQAPVTAAPPAIGPPPSAPTTVRPPPPPIIIKEENLPSEEELLEMVTEVEGKQVEEVRPFPPGHWTRPHSSDGSAPPPAGSAAHLWLRTTGEGPRHRRDSTPALRRAGGSAAGRGGGRQEHPGR